MVQEEPSSFVLFSFFVTLVHEIAKVKHREVNIKSASRHPSPAFQIFRWWIAELRKRYTSLPPRTCTVIFRLLFPAEDTRRKYNMQETRLAQSISEALGIDAAKLVNWKKDNASGCLGREVEKLLTRACAKGSASNALSIFDVDELLDELACGSGYSHASLRSMRSSSGHRPRPTVIRSLFRSMAPFEAACLTQIILKDLRPLLYPLSAEHYTAALLTHNSKAVTELSVEAAMRAWDPKGALLTIYRLKSSLDEAIEQYEHNVPSTGVSLNIGTPIRMPKSTKGRSCLHAIEVLRSARRVWAETKYDGERAQIHVEVRGDYSSRITIFSKSGRESTEDRHEVHSIIREALGLPEFGPGPAGEHCKVKANVALDAEMVAYDEQKDRVDEFWRIRSLIESTAHGVRRTRSGQPDPERKADAVSQSSLISDVSESRHLALVFFDILVLDSVSLLEKSYSERRSALQCVIRSIPGKAMFADRTAINLRGGAGIDEAEEELCEVFARLIADHQEGIVLKASESTYDDFRLPWVKLKRDYIDGYGDTVDLVVLAAGWDKERGRELRVGPSTITTLYVGALQNGPEIEKNPVLLPHFVIYFTASYGLSRAELEQTNFMIKSSESVSYDDALKPSAQLAYTFTMFAGLAAPSVVLQHPLLAELYGAGFTKARGCQYYELRFPRINKIYCRRERTWKDGVSLQGLHKIALQSIGRDRKHKDVDDWANRTWGKPVSPSAKNTPKRKLAELEWKEKLMALNRKRVKRIKPLGELGRIRNSEGGIAWGPGVAPATVQFLPLETRTNVDDHTLAASISPPRTSIRSPARERLSASHRTSPSVRKSGENSSPATNESSAPAKKTMVLYSLVSGSPVAADGPTSDYVVPGSGIGLLHNALVWFAGPRETRLDAEMRHSVPSECRLHSLESLLVGCGWHDHAACNWVARGIVIVSDGEMGALWRDHVLGKLKEVAETTTNLEDSRKPVLVFDSAVLVGGLDGLKDTAAIFIMS